MAWVTYEIQKAAADSPTSWPAWAPAVDNCPSLTAPVVSAAADKRAHPRVLIVSIDDCRPDVALRAEMPVLRSLLLQGSFTFWARTIDVAVTPPSHTSMLTGVTPARHKVDWNDDVGPERFHYPEFPTPMDLARQKGMTTALVAAKSKFVVLAQPGSVPGPKYLQLTEPSTLRRLQAARQLSLPYGLTFSYCTLGMRIRWGML